jgi:hypothetical protein
MSPLTVLLQAAPLLLAHMLAMFAFYSMCPVILQRSGAAPCMLRARNKASSGCKDSETLITMCFCRQLRC